MFFFSFVHLDTEEDVTYVHLPCGLFPGLYLFINPMHADR